MAATTKSTSKSSTSRNGSRAKSSGTSKSAASKRSSSSAKRTSSNGSRAASKSAGTSRKPAGTSKSAGASKRTSKSAGAAKKSAGASKRTSRPRSESRSTTQNRSSNGSIMDTALDRTKAVGHAVAGAASKAKTPLIAGGTAIAGAAAGVVIKDRLAANHSKGPLKRLRGVSIPNPAAKLDLSKVDLDSVKSTAERVSAYGKQASDIAAAVEKTRKKNN